MMNNRIKIRILEDSHYTIKTLYRNHINIYDIDYKETGNIYTIDESDLEKLKIDNIEVVSFKGIKSVLYKIKRHRHFIGATILSLLLVFFISNVIVEVNVIHSDKKIRLLVEDELFDLGIKQFILKKPFEKIQDIKEKIKKKHPNEIEWLEIIDDGMKYTIRVEERIITEPSKTKDFCNVISTKDAVVLGSTVSKGQNVVDNNEFVKKGDVLISGEIKFNEATKSHVCASGTVYGNTWYRVSISLPYEHTIKNYTGKSKSNIGFEYGSTYNRIFKVHYENYDVEKKRLVKIGKFALYKETVKEYTSKKEVYKEDEVLNQALKTAREKLEIKLDENASIMSEKVLQSSTYDSIISVDVFYAVKEIISTQVESEYIEKEQKEELE